jgi:hypothetical protein
MEIKKGNLNFDQTGRAYPDNPHIKENWDCIWEHEDKYYKLVGDINNKEWEEVQLGEDPKGGWTPTQGESVWIKVFSNWSIGTYIGWDIIKEVHIVREDVEGGGNLMSSKEVLPYFAMPNGPKKETLEDAADKWVFEINGYKWSNNDDTAGDNYGSFKAGAEWMREQMESLKDFETWKEWKNK